MGVSAMMLFFKLLSLTVADWSATPIEVDYYSDPEIYYIRRNLTCTPPARLECQEQCCDWSLRRQTFRCSDLPGPFATASEYCCGTYGYFYGSCTVTPNVTRHKLCCTCVAPEAPITALPVGGWIGRDLRSPRCPPGFFLSEPIRHCLHPHQRDLWCEGDNYTWSSRSDCATECAIPGVDCRPSCVMVTCLPNGTQIPTTTTTTIPVSGPGAYETCAPKPPTTTTTPNPYGFRRWEQVGIANRSACRGKNVNDNNQSYYTVRAARSLEECQELCRSEFPRCKGIEYSTGRCEIWTRPDGIFITKELSGFTCMRFGWQTRALFPIPFYSWSPVGEHEACRGEGSTYVVKVAHSLEECKAQFSAAEFDVTGIEWSMGRCEIWRSPIEFTADKHNFWCLRYDHNDPSLIVP